MDGYRRIERKAHRRGRKRSRGTGTLGRLGHLGHLGLLMLALCSGTCSARAEEPRLARVLEVGPGQVTLMVEGDAEKGSESLSVAIDQRGVPAGIGVGAWVRVWPGSAVGAGAAARLTPISRGLGAIDRTGVRARLMRGLGRGAGGGRGRR